MHETVGNYLPFELIKAQVEQEIAQSGKGLEDYLKNFRNWLRPNSGEHFDNYRSLLKMETGRISEKLHKYRLSQEQSFGHSQTWLEESDLDFVKRVNWAMSEEGVSAEIVQEMDKFARLGDIEERRIRLCEYILPVYIRIRLFGYTHDELTT